MTQEAEPKLFITITSIDLPGGKADIFLDDLISLEVDPESEKYTLITCRDKLTYRSQEDIETIISLIEEENRKNPYQ